MADETMLATAGHQSIIRGGRPIRDSDLLIRTLAVGSATAKVGMAMTGAGETHPGIDIHADGDTSILGLLLGPVIRPSDTWTIDTALADDQEVYILKPCGGQVLVACWITGLTTGDGAIKAGENIYFVDTTGAPVIANATPGGLMAVLSSVAVVDDAGFAFYPVGTASEDFTVADSGGAAVGTIEEIWY